METQIKTSDGVVGFTLPRSLSVQKFLLSCGLISSVLYVVGITYGATRWEGYNPNSQSVSELFAVDAPSASFMIPLLLLYTVLIYAFGFGVWRSAGQKRTLRIAGILIILKEVFGVIATIVTPMHLRGSVGTLTDTLHAAFTVVGVLLCMFPAIGFGAVSFGKGFKVYSLLTMLIFLTFGILAFMEAPNVAANLPTPWIGVWERINIYVYMLWISVLGITLLRDVSNKQT